jgi:hypothetical protein
MAAPRNQDQPGRSEGSPLILLLFPVAVLGIGAFVAVAVLVGVHLLFRVGNFLALIHHLQGDDFARLWLQGVLIVIFLLAIIPFRSLLLTPPKILFDRTPPERLKLVHVISTPLYLLLGLVMSLYLNFGAFLLLFGLGAPCELISGGENLPVLYGMGLLSLAAGLSGLYVGGTIWRRAVWMWSLRQKVRNCTPSQSASAAMGLIEINGQAHSTEDSPGKKPLLAGSMFSTKIPVNLVQPFWLKDGGGQLLVEPPAHLNILDDERVSLTRRGRKEGALEERYLLPGDQVYLIGNLTLNDHNQRVLRPFRPPGAKLFNFFSRFYSRWTGAPTDFFLIADQDEETVKQRLLQRWQKRLALGIVWTACGLWLSVFGLFSLVKPGAVCVFEIPPQVSSLRTEILHHLIRLEQPFFRALAADLLGKGVMNEMMFADLVDALDDPEQAVRREAWFSLNHISLHIADEPSFQATLAQLADLLAGEDRGLQIKAVEVVHSLGRQAPTMQRNMLAFINDKDARIRELAVHYFALLASHRLLDAQLVLPVLWQAGSDFRLVFLNWLKWDQDLARANRPVLQKFLDDEDAEVRKQAIQIISGMAEAGQFVLPRLIAALRDPNQEVARSAAAAIRVLDPSGYLANRNLANSLSGVTFAQQAGELPRRFAQGYTLTFAIKLTGEREDLRREKIFLDSSFLQVLSRGNNRLDAILYYEGGGFAGFWFNEKAPLPAERWYRISFVCDPLLRRYEGYIDGRMTNSMQFSESNSPELELLRVRFDKNNGSTDSGIKDVVLYDIALLPAEVRELSENSASKKNEQY